MSDYVLEGTKWASQPITWSFATYNYTADSNIPFTSQIPVVFQNIIEQAIQKWASISGLTFQLVPDSPDQNSAPDIRIGFGDLNTATTGTIGLTNYRYQNGYFNNDVILRLEDPNKLPLIADSQGVYRYQGYVTSLYQDVLHELGHTLGLGHSSDPYSIMYPSLGPNNPDVDATDVAGIQAIYGSKSMPASDFQQVAGTPDMRLSGSHASYTIYPGQDSSLHVTRSDGQTFSTQSVRLIEFTDGTLMFDSTGNGEDAARIYKGALGRTADASGLEQWTHVIDTNTTSLSGMAKEALTSSEFISRHTAILSDSDFVTMLYQNSLGRQPDPGGFNAYTSSLSSGTSRSDVLLSIAESQEAKSHFSSTIGDQDQSAIYRLYQTILGRAPDQGGLFAYAGRLDEGVPLQDLAKDMLSSAEYNSRFGSPSDETFITNLYVNDLHRTPDAGGFKAWMSNLHGSTRSQVAADFSRSTESRGNYATATHDGTVWLG